MDKYFQILSLVLIGMVLHIVVARQNKEAGILLVIFVSASVLIAAVSFLSPIMTFLGRLSELSDLDNGLAEILLKAAGITLTGEFAQLICDDSGNKSLGKSIELITYFTVVWLSLPMLQEILDLVLEVLHSV